MKSAQNLREKVVSGELALGVMATSHLWLDLLEISRNAGMDYLIIDQEHRVFDQELVIDVCSVGRLIGFPVLIRVLSPAIEHVRRAADNGACGVMVPCVESAADLDQVRDGVYMPPRGRRRPGGRGNRWVPDFNYETWRDEVERDFIVLPQIESLQGLENVEEIAAHEITTTMAVGPYDLSAALGVCWDPDAPKLVEAIDRIRAAGRARGKTTWMMGDGPTLMQQGFTFICIGEPCCMLEAMLKQRVREMRGGKDGD